jgi:Protein of unknown function (DUF3631)/Bifunctional DNA primase/polymerase, N-terminal
MHGLSHSSAQSVPHADASNLHWALYYASRGWPVLPLYSVEGGRCTFGDVNCRSPGKHPRTPHGVKDASTSSWQIQRWWKFWPSANVGIATGVASGLLVLDSDPRNGGDASLEQLRNEFPDAFKELLEVLTGSGGAHLYFECRSAAPSRANILPGIDVRADSGYVAAPPSLHISGSRYRFVSNSGLIPPPLPAALHELILPKAQAQGGGDASPKDELDSLRVSDAIKNLVREGKPRGQRSEALFAAIRAMIKAGHDDEEIIAVLVDPANGLSEKPRDKGLAWLTGEIKRARQKPDRDNRSETPFGTARPDPDRPAIHSIAGSDKDPNGHLPSKAPSPSARKPVDSPARPQEEPEIDLKMCGGNEPAPAAEGHEAAALEIQRLARLSSLHYERERENAAQRLGIRVTVLDDLVKQARAAKDEGDSKGQGRPISFSEPEPWPHAVDGADLLNGFRAALTRHVIMSKEAAVATALWIVHTFLLHVFNTSPRLAITSPEKQCGKTTLLDILGLVTRCPLPTANATPAPIFRVIEMYGPTLLIDEADTFLDNRSELRGILNSGHRRGTAYVLRTVGDDHEPRKFSTWTAVAIAMIGRLPGTLEDRSIPVALRRRRPDEPIVSFKHDAADDLRRLARMAARWCHDHADEIGRAVPAVPDGIYNRQADNWSPLLAIADKAGGDWPERARQAAKTLTVVGAGDDQSIRIQLLADFRMLFESRQDAKITTKDVIDGLVAIEERPWSVWHRGKPISPAALAKLLAPFGIVPVNLKLPDERVLKGYRREHFEDAFARYLPPPPIVAATPLLRPSDGHNLHVSRPLPGDGGSGCANSENPNNHAQSSGVAAVKAPESSANGAAIPFMITHAMKDQLRGRGLSDDQIANLTPQKAHEILNSPADK